MAKRWPTPKSTRTPPPVRAANDAPRAAPTVGIARYKAACAERDALKAQIDPIRARLAEIEKLYSDTHALRGEWEAMKAERDAAQARAARRADELDEQRRAFEDNKRALADLRRDYEAVLLSRAYANIDAKAADNALIEAAKQIAQLTRDLRYFRRETEVDDRLHPRRYDPAPHPV